MLFDVCCRNSLVIKKGELYGCGRNSYGELGLGHNRQVDTFTKIDHTFDGSGVKSIKSNETFSLALTNDGNVFSCGSVFSKALGFSVNDSKDVLIFTRIPTLKNIIMIDATNFFSVAVSCNKVYVWGVIYRNEFPRSRSIEWIIPTEINPACDHIYKIATGPGFLIVLTNTGLWILGSWYGCVSHGD